MHAMHLLHSVAMRPNLELKTRAKQLLGSLPLDIALPAVINTTEMSITVIFNLISCSRVGLGAYL